MRWRQWTKAARAPLGRAVWSCPDRVVGLADVERALRSDGPSTIHLPGRDGFSATVQLSFDLAEALSRDACERHVGVIYLVSGLVDAAFAHRGRVPDDLLVSLCRRQVRLLGGAGADDEIAALLAIGESFNASPSMLLTRYVLGSEDR